MGKDQERQKAPVGNSLYHKLNIIFGLFFLFPILGFIIFAIKYNILADEQIPLFFLGVLVFSFLGFFILRRIFDNIIAVATSINRRMLSELQLEMPQTVTDDLQNIVRSFNAIGQQWHEASAQLKKRASEITTLKELSELCYITFDGEEILSVTLERALIVTNSDIGSLMLLEDNEHKAFVVKATVGLGELAKIGDSIDFDSSIAKYAVINKSPLLVNDIEKERRFGRTNRPHYGTKSFICMPIKTSKDVIGVVTLSRSNTEAAFSQDDVEVLTPLLSNAAFTYENLRLLRENKHVVQNLRVVEKIFAIINSSSRGSERVHSFLNEIQAVTPFDIAIIMTKDDQNDDCMKILDVVANKHASFNRDEQFFIDEKGIIGKVVQHGAPLIVDASTGIQSDLEWQLFGVHNCKTCIIAPLKLDGVTGGVILLGAHTPGLFNNSQELIEWLAIGLSLAIERDTLSAAVLKRSHELDTIRQIGRALASSTFDMSKVLKYTMDMIRMIMDVEAGSLFLLEGNELEFAVAFNMDVEPLKKIHLKLGQGIAGYAAARGESIIVNNTSTSPHFYSDVDKTTGLQTRSALCVPVISQGKVIGVLEVLNKMNGSFTLSDRDLLQSIATSVSIAIENARLYKETVTMAENERGIRKMFQKFVPKEILDKILCGTESGKTIIEEMKTLTLLNIDIRGFSKFSKEIGPQKTVALLNHFFSVMGCIVFKNHGIVDKYLGDGFLAIFGAPVSGTCDADNAVSAALEMRDAVDTVNEYAVRELGFSVMIGISVHTGEAVVGNIGFDMKMDYTVIGDTVNAVFRLQEITKNYPNSILISEITRRAVRSHLGLRDLGILCDIDDAHGALNIYELLSRLHEEMPSARSTMQSLPLASLA